MARKFRSYAKADCPHGQHCTERVTDRAYPDTPPTHECVHCSPRCPRCDRTIGHCRGGMSCFMNVHNNQLHKDGFAPAYAPHLYKSGRRGSRSLVRMCQRAGIELRLGLGNVRPGHPAPSNGRGVMQKLDALMYAPVWAVELAIYTPEERRLEALVKAGRDPAFRAAVQAAAVAGDVAFKGFVEAIFGPRTRKLCERCEGSGTIGYKTVGESLAHVGAEPCPKCSTPRMLKAWADKVAAVVKKLQATAVQPPDAPG